ncbi:MAG: YceD family protein, partial [bacterium]
RCLEKFEYNFNIDIEKELNKLDIKDIKEVDIRQILKSNIFLDLPIKPLCSEDCKGLCPQCGQNLNKGDCNCERDIIDPRLAKLEKFFDEK